jgi:hypothetical protein
MADIDRMPERPRAYLAGSGVLPLTTGLVCLTYGVFALLQSRLMQTPEYRVYALVVQYVGIGCMLAVFWGITAIKRRMVFPRGGYVQLARPRGGFLAAAGVLVFGALAFLVSLWPGARLSLDSRLIAPTFASLFAVVCFSTTWKERRSGALAFGLYLLCLAFVLWWMRGNSYEGMAMLAVAVGLPMAITGALRLRRYLKANPVEPETPNE